MTVGRIAFGPKITESELLAAVDAAVGACEDQQPKGSITATQYASGKDIPYSTAIGRLSRAVRAGTMRAVSATILDFRGHRTAVKCFIPVEVTPCPSLTASTTGRPGKTQTPNGGSGTRSKGRKGAR